MTIDPSPSQLLIYAPFGFPVESFRSMVAAAQAAHWMMREKSTKVWDDKPIDLSNLLPHVAKFVNPSDSANPTARIWTLSQEALTSPNGGLGLGGSPASTDWILHTPHRHVPFSIEAIDLALFHSGVGLVVFQVVAKNSASEDDWLDLLHYIRFFQGQRGVRLQATRRISKTEEAAFFPTCAGGLGEHPEGLGCLDDILHGLLDTCFSQATPPTLEDVYVKGQALPFAILYVDNLPDELRASFFHRARRFYHATQSIAPAEDEVDRDPASLISHAKNQWFAFALDGGVFVAFDSPSTDFYRKTLPERLKSQYNLIFAIILFQRFSLVRISEQVASYWLIDSAEEREKAFGSIREMLFAFSARGFFTQVTQGSNHHRFYQHWQATFELERQFHEVSDEVHHLHEALQDAHAKRLQSAEEARQEEAERLRQRIDVLTWLFGPVSVVLALLQVTGTVSWGVALMWLFGAFLVSALAYNLLRRWPLIRKR